MSILDITFHDHFPNHIPPSPISNDLDPDPTVAAVAAYDMTAAEIVIGWFLLAATPLMYLIAKTFHGAYEGPPDPNRITRTPESAFDGVPQPFAPHYFQVFDPVYNVSTVLVNMKSDVQGLPRFISQ